MNMKLKLLFLAVLLALLPSAFAVNGITLTPPSYSLSLDSQTALNAVYGISNDSGQRVCFSVRADSNQDKLEAVVASPSFCLNNSERTDITLTAIASDETPSGSFNVRLIVSHDLGTELHDLNVLVMQSPAISFSVSSGQEFCNNKSISIPATVQNNSSAAQWIEVEANAPEFLPRVDKPSFSLEASQSKGINVKMNTNSTTKTGTHYFVLNSRTPLQVSAQRFSFTVKKCEEEPTIESGFSLDVPSDCLNINPGKDKFADFTIDNTGNQPITVWFSIQKNGLEIDWDDENKSPVTLDPEEGIRSSIKITAPEGIKETLYHVTVNASSLNDSQTKNICVIVARPFSLDLFPNSVMIENGESFGVALSIENKWNTSQTVSLSALEIDGDTHVSFARTSVSLKKYEKKTVIATVQTDSNSLEGLHSLRFKASNSNGIQTKLLYFTVLPAGVPPEPPPTEPIEAVLDFLSYPTAIDLNAGESREIAFVVANDGNQTVSGIQLRFEGLPINIAFVGPSRFDLAAGEARSLRGTLVVGSDIPSGTSSVRLIASNNQFKATRRVQLDLLGTKEAEQQTNPVLRIITGLIGFGTKNWVIGLIILALIIGWMIWSKNKFWTGLVALIVLLIILSIWLELGWNPLWFVLLILLLWFASFAVSWSKDHDSYNRHKEKWRQVARSL